MIVHNEKSQPARNRFFRFRDGRAFTIRPIFRTNWRCNCFQLNHESRAFGFPRTLDMNISTVSIDHCLANGEAKAEAAKAARDGSLALLECVEDFTDLFLLNADSGVADANLNF